MRWLPLLAIAACSAAPPRDLTPKPAPPLVIETVPSAVPVASASAEPAPPPPDSPDVFAALALLPKVEQRTTAPAIGAKFGAKIAKMWDAKVGRTTFRTTMAKVGEVIVIGTHGDTLDKPNEVTDGIYLLEASTGKLRALLKTPGSGDRDVGGIAIDDERIFFTSDNGLVGMFEHSKFAWQQNLGGKVRPAPALGDFDRDGVMDVVAGNETGELAAFAGTTGMKLWSHQSGESDYGHKGYIGSPAIADVDGDGGDDVIAGGRDGVLEALRGSDGSVIWQLRQDSGIHASPSFADLDGDGKRELIASWSYGNLLVIDPKDGHALWGMQLEMDGGGIEGLFGSPVPIPGKPGLILQATSWWGKEDGVIGVGPIQRDFKSHEGRVSASAVVIDLDGDGNGEAIIGTEEGKLLAFGAAHGREELAKLGGKIEAPALLADVDGNGTTEILVASNDGLLTCFGTKVARAPIISRFRGDDPRNRGDFGSTPLGWVAPKTLPPREPKLAICCAAIEATANSAPPDRRVAFTAAAAACRALERTNQDRAQSIASLRSLLGNLPAACR